jgi:hypothetical protein
MTAKKATKTTTMKKMKMTKPTTAMKRPPLTPKLAEAYSRFRVWCVTDMVFPTGSKMDEGDTQDWFSLSLGFFAALGLSADEAHLLALRARYDDHYWREDGSDTPGTTA